MVSSQDEWLTRLCFFDRKKRDFNSIMNKTLNSLNTLSTGIEELCYQDRLKKLKLTTLDTKGIRGNLIEVYKL